MNSKIKIITTNKKAYHDYLILETFEAGLALLGTEVKAVRLGKVSLKEGWIDIVDEANRMYAFLRQVHIGVYSHGNIHNHEPMRPRGLLLRRKQLEQLEKQVAIKGHTIVPLKVYIKGRLVKLQLGVARGKKTYDKRESEKQKEAQRTIDRAMKDS